MPSGIPVTGASDEFFFRLSQIPRRGMECSCTSKHRLKLTVVDTASIKEDMRNPVNSAAVNLPPRSRPCRKRARMTSFWTS